MTELKLQEYQFHDMILTWLRGADKLTDAGTLLVLFQKLCGHVTTQLMKRI